LYQKLSFVFNIQPIEELIRVGFNHVFHISPEDNKKLSISSIYRHSVQTYHCTIHWEVF